MNWQSESWWDPKGPWWTLHAMQRLRASWALTWRSWANLKLLDVGCGGGLWSEFIAREGACVTGIDVDESLILVARAHAQGQALSLEYRIEDVQRLSCMQVYDVVSAFELLEHLERPFDAVLQMMASLKCGGQLILACPNRTAWSFFAHIIMGEYVLEYLPMGTHRYRSFIPLPVMLSFLLKNGMKIVWVKGMLYQPITQEFFWSENTSMHYTIVAEKLA